MTEPNASNSNSSPIPRPVPMSLWGKDHWSMLGYAECRCVDNGGEPCKDHMRTDIDRHPGLCGGEVRRAMVELGNAKYPTRLRDGLTMSDHDDWDCADDLEAAGLLEILGTGLYPVWRMTEAGTAMASKLRQHKTGGSSFSSFRPEPTP